METVYTGLIITIKIITVGLRFKSTDEKAICFISYSPDGSGMRQSGKTYFS